MGTYMLPLSVFQIRELLLDDGSSPFGKWFSKLDHVSAVKVQVALALARWKQFKQNKSDKEI